MKRKLLREFKVGAFDALCQIAAGMTLPSVKDLEGGTPSDLFAYASDVVKEIALGLYPDVRNFEAKEFNLFMSEAYEGDNASDYLAFDEDIKEEAYGEFCNHFRTKNLVVMMQDERFNTLYFTGYSDGLAVLHIQNPKKLRIQILERVCECLSQKGIGYTTFLTMDFGEQKTICAQLDECFIALTQCVDSVFPNMPAST